MALNAKQRKFVAEYLKCGNGTKAAIRAGYSKKTAASQAYDLLRKPEIAAAIDASLEKVEISAEKVLKGLFELAYFDPAEFYELSGALKNIHDMPKAARMALTGLEAEELFEGRGDERVQIGNTVKVKWVDRHKALELLGKHLALFTDKHQVELGPTLEQLVLESLKDKK